MNKLKFWLKEYYLRFIHVSCLTNQTQYNQNTDKILNECLDNPNVVQICRTTIKFAHPSGKTYEFWTANWSYWSYAYGHDHLCADYRNHGVYYTTRYRLKNFIESQRHDTFNY